MGFPLAPLPAYRREQLILSVREATSWLDRRQFAGLPWRIYRGDRYWVPPLRSDRRRSCSPRYNPILQGDRSALFLAEARNVGLTDETVGGIAVWLAPEDEEDAIARFGCFEAVNEPDVAEALIEAAEFWLLERFAISAIRGPYALDSRYAPGLLTDGYNLRSPAFLPYNPPYYPEMLEHAGYEPVSSAQAFTLPARLNLVAADAARVVSAQQDAEIWEQVRTLYGDEMPGSAHFGLILEAHSGRMGVVSMTPDPVERGLAGRVIRREETRLWARPAITAPMADDVDLLKTLYAAAAHTAARLGHAQIIVAPVDADDANNLQALEAAGAQLAQTYQVYEKRF